MNVRLYSGTLIISAPNEVISEYSLKKCRDFGISPRSNECNGSGGEVKIGSFTCH